MRFKIHLETILYLTAFAIALSLRLANLGAVPLNDSEAHWAIQALTLGDTSSAIGAQPGYVLISGLLFKLMSSGNALARMLPALAGSLLVFLPALLLSRKGISLPKLAGILFAFGVAIDPSLSALSRQVGSQIPAVSMLLLCGCATYARKPILAGIFAGLAVLSGPAVLQGLIALGLAYILIVLLQKADWLAPMPTPEDNTETNEEEFDRSQAILQGLIAAGITVLLVGTQLLVVPKGLSGIAATLTDFLNGWIQVVSPIPISRIFAALVFYESLPLIFGVVGIFLAWKNKDGISQCLTLFFLGAILIPMLYPSRQVGDLAWSLIPLWGLAAISLAQLLPASGEERSIRWVSVLHALFLVILMVVLRMNLLGWQAMDQAIVLLLFGGVIMMGLIATAMIAVGWSAKLAKDGAVWAFAFGGTIALLAGTFWGTQARANTAVELWTPAPAIGQADQFGTTLTHLSASNAGLVNQIEILSTVDTPSMRWALREFPNVRYASQVAVTDQTPVVITYDVQDTLESGGSYRGQSFDWAIYPAWQSALPPSWLQWVAFRKGPVASTKIILWARTDLFPGETSQP